MIKILILMTLIVSCKTLKKVKKNLKEPIYEYHHNHKTTIDFPSNLPNDFYKLKSFKIYETKEQYIFSIKMEEAFSINRMLPGLWDSILFDIYLNLGEGKNFQALYGRKLRIYSWDKVIVVSPLKISNIKMEMNNKNRKVSDDFSVIENLTQDIIISEERSLAGNELIVSVSKSSIGEGKKIEGVQLLVMGLDINGKKHTVKKIKQFLDESSFGGGKYSRENSNVISIIGDQNDLSSFQREGKKVKFAETKTVSLKR